MPNITFVGFLRDEYFTMKSRIDKMMAQIDLAGEVVTTFLPGSLCESCDDQKATKPFLKIFCTESVHLKMILDIFFENKFFYDIEVVCDGEFFSATDQQQRFWQQENDRSEDEISF